MFFIFLLCIPHPCVLVSVSVSVSVSPACSSTESEWMDGVAVCEFNCEGKRVAIGL